MRINQNLRKDKTAIIGVDFIIAAIIILIIAALAIAMVYPMIGGVNTRATDLSLAKALGQNTTTYRPGGNATISLLTNTGVALSLSPMMAIASIAAGIITMLLYAFATAGRPGL